MGTSECIIYATVRGRFVDDTIGIVGHEGHRPRRRPKKGLEACTLLVHDVPQPVPIGIMRVLHKLSTISRVPVTWSNNGPSHHVYLCLQSFGYRAAKVLNEPISTDAAMSALAAWHTKSNIPRHYPVRTVLLLMLWI